MLLGDIFRCADASFVSCGVKYSFSIYQSLLAVNPRNVQILVQKLIAVAIELITRDWVVSYHLFAGVLKSVEWDRLEFVQSHRSNFIEISGR
jgi:hypothetical protein